MTLYEFAEHLFTQHPDQAATIVFVLLLLLGGELLRAMIHQRGRKDDLEEQQEARVDHQLSDLIGLVRSLTEPMTARLDQLLTELVGATKKNEEVTAAVPQEVLALVLPELKQVEATLTATFRQAEANIIAKLEETSTREEKHEEAVLEPVSPARS